MNLGINFIMIGLKQVLLFILMMKYSLDFLSPFREMNFVLFNLSVLFFLLVFRRMLIKVSSFEWLTLLILSIAFLYWGAVGEDQAFLIKYLSMLPLYLLLKVGLTNLSLNDLSWLTKRSLTIYMYLLLANFSLSLLFAEPSKRMFFNFEHANLLGSYVLLSLTFVYSNHYLSGNNTYKSKAFVSVMAFLSTSTGAFLSSLMTFVRPKKFALSTVLGITLFIFVTIIIGYFITKAYSPSLHTKIFGPFELLFLGGFEELSILAKHRFPIQELGSEYDSSLLWRFYAYLVFWHFALSQDIISFVFGNGFWGFSNVWEGIAPHNDFLLVLIDFGVIAFGFVLYSFYRIFSWALKNEMIIVPLLFV